MNQSSVYPRNEPANYGGYEFDYQADFTQCLEEARKSACQVTLSNVNPEHKQPEEVKLKRKSWKKSLFSWLKATDKKGNKSNKEQQMNGTAFPKASRRGHVSGPVQGTGAGSINGRVKKAASGPLVGLFSSSMKRVESYEVPYMCLSQLNSPHSLQTYGPVYLVT